MKRTNYIYFTIFLIAGVLTTDVKAERRNCTLRTFTPNITQSKELVLAADILDDLNTSYKISCRVEISERANETIWIAIGKANSSFINGKTYLSLSEDILSICMKRTIQLNLICDNAQRYCINAKFHNVTQKMDELSKRSLETSRLVSERRDSKSPNFSSVKLFGLSVFVVVAGIVLFSLCVSSQTKQNNMSTIASECSDTSPLLKSHKPTASFASTENEDSRISKVFQPPPSVIVTESPSTCTLVEPPNTRSTQTSPSLQRSYIISTDHDHVDEDVLEKQLLKRLSVYSSTDSLNRSQTDSEHQTTPLLQINSNCLTTPVSSLPNATVDKSIQLYDTVKIHDVIIQPDSKYWEFYISEGGAMMYGHYYDISTNFIVQGLFLILAWKYSAMLKFT